MTIDTIERIARSILPAHLVTASGAGGEHIDLPGCQIYVDDSDPAAPGWAYREARAFDADTMAWDGDESGPVDDEADVRALVERAALRMRS